MDSIWKPNGRSPVRIVRAVGAVAAVALVLVACAPVPRSKDAAPPASPTWQAQMLASLNTQRAAAGVAPLTACAALDRAAQDHSADQAANNEMSHTGSDGSSPWERMHRAGYYYNAAAENVAAGQRDVASAMAAWMNSSGHRTNIENGTYVHVGVGKAHSAGGTPYWTQKFGRGGSC